MVKKIYQETEKRMEKVVEDLKHQLQQIRTGRASPALLDNVKVNYYGAQVPIKQVGGISIPEAKLIEIRPWDQNIIKEVEKAILASNIGLTPNTDGKVIRLKIPPLSEERRKELVKILHKITEDHRISARNTRREANEELKKLEHEKQITEDDRFNGEKQIQELTGKLIKKLDEVCEHKEKEIMEV